MNPEYVVMIINLVIWSGIFVYLWKTDRAVKKLEQEIKHLHSNEKSDS
ncbi:CcmD family protein [Caldithrix abyssi]|uniref:CcmD family protein n=1 Tax=Caldithrix abyssi DSM 13497 TaxID=880073 RepID=H1XY32_CALAY|nr:CcmD family protein [Caldithrix abyssi]APF17901.1 CcmD family protein [Caldithrix abyssi DSM 13497]EHO41959.1 hypothetical protein Calab_2349 [Caldithrix abyssi DSM 13497]